MNDCNFPLIKYKEGDTPTQWGQQHGEEFRSAIKELVEIRREMLLQRNPKLVNHIDQLARLQWDASVPFAPNEMKELEGIISGAEITLEEGVILNNYTDFRDIDMSDQGCSTIYTASESGSLSGQTWDMHRSAKKYVCTIHAPANEYSSEMVLFSLVGCVGMMGINSHGLLVGVNNINTIKAKAGLIWPVLVRNTLSCENRMQVREKFEKAPVTSGHNYIVSDHNGGEHWEVSPLKCEMVSSLTKDNRDTIFHTNHCLGEFHKTVEAESGINSTTHLRYSLIEKKKKSLNNFDDLYQLLTDHEEHPKSICSHFESGAQDPSFTCGGGVYEASTGKTRLWRGCPQEEDYLAYDFELKNNSFNRTS